MTNVIRQLRQVAGVDSVKVADFKRGIFAVTPRRGVRLSESALLAAARRSGFQPDRVVPPGGSSQPATPSRPPGESRGLASELAAARVAFRKGRYDEALKLAREVAQKPQPNLDTTGSNAGARKARDKAEALAAEIQQFLSLVNFAMGRYDDAANAARAGLHHGAPWKWETLRSHYMNSADYTAQLRALENAIRQKSTPEKRLLVAYHYWMLGQTQAARTQFERVAQMKPDDKLVSRVIKELQKAREQ